MTPADRLKEISSLTFEQVTTLLDLIERRLATSEDLRTGLVAEIHTNREVERQLRAQVADLSLRAERVEQERDEAMRVLAPNMPESGLVDACKQVKQVAISEVDNSEKAEAALSTALGERDAEQQMRVTEVEHWVEKYNTLEKWRIQTAQHLAAAEARIKELEQR